MSLNDFLKYVTFDNIKWEPDDKPVLIADDRLMRICELDEPIKARSSYVVGVNQTSFHKLCRILNS